MKPQNAGRTGRVAQEIEHLPNKNKPQYHHQKKKVSVESIRILKQRMNSDMFSAESLW
jgi:hypothetical protein